MESAMNGRTIKLTNKDQIQVKQCRKYESLENENKWFKYTNFQYLWTLITLPIAKILSAKNARA